MALFAKNHENITLSHKCGAKQGSVFTYPLPNVVALFKPKVLFFPQQLPHLPLMDRYTLKLYFQDNRSKAEHLILIIKSCCDDNTRYTIALLLKPLITKVQWSLVLSGDLPLIKKLVANTSSVPFLSSTAD